MQGIYEIWGEGTCWHDFVKDIRAQSSKRIQAFQSKDVSWKIIVDSLFHTLKHSDQLQFINDLAFLNFKVGYSHTLFRQALPGHLLAGGSIITAQSVHTSGTESVLQKYT